MIVIFMKKKIKKERKKETKVERKRVGYILLF